MSTLLKVPLIGVGTVVSCLAFRPPESPPRHGEQHKYGSRDVLSRTSRWMPFVAQAGMLTISLCEIIVIVAERLPFYGSQVHSYLMPWTPSPSDVRITNVFLFGWLLQTSGGLFRLASFRHLGRFFTYELAVRENHDLITSGPYSVVRHPGYAGFVACIIGMWMCQLGSGSWLVESGILETTIGKFGAFGWVSTASVVLFSMVWRTRREDDILKKEFGQRWVEWSKRTPYKLIPGIY